VISQESLLRSGKRPLQVSMGIPDVVLTGSRYDIDLIVDEPLGQAIVAGGVIELTDQQLAPPFRNPTCGWPPWVVEGCSNACRLPSGLDHKPGR
jgi:hypothetical protein